MCVFCEIVKGNIPSYKVYEDENVLAFLDISRATPGHTLIVTKKHYDNILSISDEDSAAVMKAAKIVANKIKTNLGVENINVLNNCGSLAGQTVMHFHMHLIPRYSENDVTLKFTEHDFDKDALEEMCNKLNK